jgi:hypothetical protein
MNFFQTQRVCMFIEIHMVRKTCDPRGVEYLIVQTLFYKHVMPPASKILRFFVVINIVKRFPLSLSQTQRVCMFIET